MKLFVLLKEMLEYVYFINDFYTFFLKKNSFACGFKENPQVFSVISEFKIICAGFLASPDFILRHKFSKEFSRR